MFVGLKSGFFVCSWTPLFPSKLPGGSGESVSSPGIMIFHENVVVPPASYFVPVALKY